MCDQVEAVSKRGDGAMMGRSALLVACGLTVLAMSGGIGRAQSGDPIRIVDVAELSGSGATTGVNWKNGADLAVKEINASGGILGRQVQLEHYDNQSNPGVSRGLMQKALDRKPDIILGPVSSGAVKSSQGIAQEAQIPEFIGAEAADLSEQGNPYLFRTSFGQQASMPKVARYLKDELKAKKVAVIWINNEFGRGGRDAFVKSAKADGLEIAIDISSEVGQADFAADVTRIRSSGADIVFAYLIEDESARFLIEAKRQGLAIPVIGETTLLGQKVIDLAGSAANGVRGHVGLTADAPIDAVAAFRQRFMDAYKYAPDHNCIKGYIAVQTVKAVATKIKTLDGEKFAKALHGMTITPQDEPGILLTTTWNEKGDIDRDSFLVEVDAGKQKVTKVLPRLGK
jgi:branched-chain amino acid transport system substrate-binding protein